MVQLRQSRDTESNTLKAKSSFPNIAHSRKQEATVEQLVRISWHAPQTVTDLLQLSYPVYQIHCLGEKFRV